MATTLADYDLNTGLGLTDTENDSTRCDPVQVKAALNLLRPLAVNDAMRGRGLNRQTTCSV